MMIRVVPAFHVVPEVDEARGWSVQSPMYVYATI